MIGKKAVMVRPSCRELFKKFNVISLAIAHLTRHTPSLETTWKKWKQIQKCGVRIRYVNMSSRGPVLTFLVTTKNVFMYKNQAMQCSSSNFKIRNHVTKICKPTSKDHLVAYSYSAECF